MSTKNTENNIKKKIFVTLRQLCGLRDLCGDNKSPQIEFRPQRHKGHKDYNYLL
jgi:hypothetical protein